MPDNESITRQNRKTIVLLLLAFIAPAIIAWMQFKFEIFSSGTKNYGEFITPPIVLEQFNLTSVDGSPFTLKNIKRNWHLVYLGYGACKEKCRDRLSMMHQSRMAQGKGMSRVRLIYISMDEIEKGQAKELTSTYSRLSVLTGSDEQLKKIGSLFGAQAIKDIRTDNLIFMIDPLGNLMMKYKDDVRLIGIIKDLEHLLKVSQVG